MYTWATTSDPPPTLEHPHELPAAGVCAPLTFWLTPGAACFACLSAGHRRTAAGQCGPRVPLPVPPLHHRPVHPQPGRPGPPWPGWGHGRPRQLHLAPAGTVRQFLCFPALHSLLMRGPHLPHAPKNSTHVVPVLQGTSLGSKPPGSAGGGSARGPHTTLSFTPKTVTPLAGAGPRLGADQGVPAPLSSAISA
jgi:hypothetical protein